MKMSAQLAEMLGEMAPSLFQASAVLTPIEGARGGLHGALVHSKEFSAATVKYARKNGLVDGCRITNAGILAYQDWLADRSS